MSIPSEAAQHAGRYVVVVPVKPPAVGKSRLVAEVGGALTDVDRRELARAFALDTVEAALAATLVAAVLAVTDDAVFSRELVALGGAAIPDGVSLDLNAALTQGAAEADRRWPGHAVAALCADLPALDPADLDTALAEASLHLAAGTASYVADTEGVGTTMYAAAPAAFAPRFGAGSAAAHAGSGARAVGAAVPTLRRDVDDVDDLREALRHGVGRRTAGVVARVLG